MKTFQIHSKTFLVAKDFEVAVWQGTDVGGSFTGLQARLAANSDVIDITAETLNAGNIIAKLKEVRAAIPSEVYVADDFAIYIPISAEKFYTEAQAALGYMDKYYDGKTPLNFMGIPLKVAHGLGDNKMVAARASDLHFGTNVLTDMVDMRVLDMTELDGSDNVRFILKVSGGTQITNPTNIVYYA